MAERKNYARSLRFGKILVCVIALTFPHARLVAQMRGTPDCPYALSNPPETVRTAYLKVAKNDGFL
jgi:hypothetical protein